MIVKLMTIHHLEFLSFKGGCRGSSKSTHVKMPYCWKSHVLAQFYIAGDSSEPMATVNDNLLDLLWSITVAIFVLFGMIGALISGKVADYFGRYFL